MSSGKPKPRCIGHCCKEFSFPFGPDELDDNLSRVVDGMMIADMVIYIGHRAPQPPLNGDNGSKRHLYTCKYLKKNGDCAVYCKRPKMCRDYPYGKSCAQPECMA